LQSSVFDPALEVFSGTHKIQRTPSTEKAQRRHTSEVKVVWVDGRTTPTSKLQASDVEESFIRTGGKGGQHRNKVSTAVRLFHQPTGIIVVSDEERQQAQNRAVAWKRLETRLLEAAVERSHLEVNHGRASVWASSRLWKWTEWRDEVITPEGKRYSYRRLLRDLGKAL
jgi:protein subunit release factor A